MTELTKDNRWTLRWNGEDTVRAVIRYGWNRSEELGQTLAENKWQADEWDTPSTTFRGISGKALMEWIAEFAKADLMPKEIWLTGKGENANVEYGVHDSKLDCRIYHATKGRFTEAIAYLKEANNKGINARTYDGREFILPQCECVDCEKLQARVKELESFLDWTEKDEDWDKSWRQIMKEHQSNEYKTKNQKVNEEIER